MELFRKFLNSDDIGLKHVAILIAGQNKDKKFESKLLNLLKNPERSIRYAAATSLILYKNKIAIPILKEILALSLNSDFGIQKVYALKRNVLYSLRRERWRALDNFLEKMRAREKDLKTLNLLNETLKLLKNE